MTFGLAPAEVLLVAFAAFASGCVRGFAGFGTAMVYLPMAGQVLSPFAALTTLCIIDLIGPLPNMPRALREGDRRDIAVLMLGLVLLLPVGLWVLTIAPPEVFRWAVSVIALTLVACLLAGLRYRGSPSDGVLLGTGAASGFLAGVAGLPGPPVILLYMASLRPARVVRANSIVYLTLTDVAMLPALALFGRLDGAAVLLGLAMIVPSLAGNVAGAALFRPGREVLYRRVAYAVIATSALSGLPLWD